MALKNNINSEGLAVSNVEKQELLTRKRNNARQLENNNVRDEHDSQEEVATDSFIPNFTSLGVSLPSIMVSKIVLEPTGGDIIPENNPHVDDVQGANIQYDKYGNIQFVSKTLDYLTKTTTPAGLLVKLSLSIKEVLKSTSEQSLYTTANDYGTWFDNDDFLKYLNIRVVQSTSPKLTNLFKEGEIGIDTRAFEDQSLLKHYKENLISVKNAITKEIKDYNSYTDSDGNTIYDIVFETSFFHNTTSPPHLSYFVQTFLDVEQISADNGCGAANLTAAELGKVQGYTVAELVIDKSRVSENGFAYRTPENKLWLGPVYYQKGIGFSNVGDSSASNFISLKRLVVPNTKIEDQRDSLNFEKAEIEFSLMETELQNLNLSFLEKSVVDVKKVAEYFSELYGTRSSDGTFRGMIGFNFQKFLRDNSEFGKLFTNPNLSVVDDLADTCKISMVKIIRERVENIDSYNVVNSIVEGRVPFGTHLPGIVTNSEPVHTVVYSSAGAGKMLKPYARNVTISGETVEPTEKNKALKSSLKRQGYIAEINVHPTTDKSVRHFSFSDDQIKTATDGLYRYGIEITVEDGVRKYLQSVASKLLQAKDKLEKYYNHCTLRTNGKLNYNAKIEKYTQSFVNLKKSQYPTPVSGRIRGKTQAVYYSSAREINPPTRRKHHHQFLIDKNGNGRTSTTNGHYHRVKNFKIGRAIKEGKRKVIKDSHSHATIIQGSSSSAPWIEPIGTYIEVLDFFSAGQHGMDTLKLAFMLYKMLNPESGKPENILRLIKLIDNLYHKIQAVFGAPVQISNPTATRSGQRGTKVVKFVKMFDEIYDSNVQKEVGYDYLDIGEGRMFKKDKGLYVIDGTSYILRAKQETNRFFCPEYGGQISISAGSKRYVSGDLVANNELSFLSPARASLGAGKSYNFLTSCNFSENIWTIYELDSIITGYNLSTVVYKNLRPSMAMTAVSSTKENSMLKVQNNAALLLGGFSAIASDISETSLSGMLKIYPITIQRCIEKVENYFETESPFVQQLSTRSTELAPILPKSFMVQIAEETNGTLDFLASPVKNSSLLSRKTLDSPFGTVSPSSMSADTLDIAQPYNILSTVSSDEFVLYPNQIKSLFIGNSPLRKMIDLSESEEADSTTKAAAESVIRFNTQLLRKIEVLAGYNIKETGELLIKDPQWTELTYDLYNSNTGKILLCRLKQYSNVNTGTNTQALSELPVYNEYFMLEPKKQEAAKTTRTTTRNPNSYRSRMQKRRTKITNRINTNIGTQILSGDKLGSNMLITDPNLTTESVSATVAENPKTSYSRGKRK